MKTDWILKAACRGLNPEWWFPFSGIALEGARAVKICATCPVRAECYNYAVTNKEIYGIWGGVAFGGRRNITRGSYEEEELRDAVYKSLDAGWSINKTATHLRMPFNTAQRFARERYQELNPQGTSLKEDQDKEVQAPEVGVDDSSMESLPPTERLFHRMKKLLKGETP